MSQAEFVLRSAKRSSAQGWPRREIPSGPGGFLTQCVKNRNSRRPQRLGGVGICDAVYSLPNSEMPDRLLLCLET